MAAERERLYLFDTTLRDGAQTNGVDFTLTDKFAIIRMLDELGIDYIEGGYPGANPTDTQLFSETRMLNATFTAFGMVRRPGRSTSNDPGWPRCSTPRPRRSAFVAKSWDYHVRVALETTPEENLASIRDSVKAAKDKGREVLLDCEHFFDGYKANPSYALACAKAAHEAGASWVVLCDTNGGTLPHEVEAIVREVVKHVPGDHLGIHAHNDTEQAVANSFAAVRAGVRQIQGTLNGLGERCGNANLVSIIPTLKLKPEYSEQVRDQRVGRAMKKSPPRVARARRAAQPLAEPPRALCWRQRVRHQGRHPRLGHRQGAGDLRAHRAGGRRQSPQASGVGPGRPLQRAGRARAHRTQGRQERQRVARLLDEVKEREATGYAYETAAASFELLARRMLGTGAEVLRRQLFRRQGRAARPERTR
jgi:2-isopropylmalate synthase